MRFLLIIFALSWAVFETVQAQQPEFLVTGSFEVREAEWNGATDPSRLVLNPRKGQEIASSTWNAQQTAKVSSVAYNVGTPPNSDPGGCWIDGEISQTMSFSNGRLQYSVPKHEFSNYMRCGVNIHYWNTYAILDIWVKGAPGTTFHISGSATGHETLTGGDVSFDYKVVGRNGNSTYTNAELANISESIIYSGTSTNETIVHNGVTYSKATNLTVGGGHFLGYSHIINCPLVPWHTSTASVELDLQFNTDREECDCVNGSVVKDVTLPEIEFDLDEVKGISFQMVFDSVDLDFTVYEPVEDGEICRAISEVGTLPVRFPVHIRLPGGAISDYKHKLFDYQIGSSTTFAIVSLFGGVEPYVRWSSPGFAIRLVTPDAYSDVELFTFIPDPVEIPLGEIGADVDQCFEEILRRVEPHLHEKLSKKWFGYVPYLVDLLIIADPGQTNLLVKDREGQRVGVDENRAVLSEIPGSLYIPEYPVVIIPFPSDTSYFVQVTGVEGGEYSIQSGHFRGAGATRSTEHSFFLEKGNIHGYHLHSSDSQLSFETGDEATFPFELADLVFSEARVTSVAKENSLIRIKYDFTLSNEGQVLAQLDGPTSSRSDNQSIVAFFSKDTILDSEDVYGHGLLLAAPGDLGPSETLAGNFWASTANLQDPFGFIETHPYLILKIMSGTVKEGSYANNTFVLDLRLQTSDVNYLADKVLHSKLIRKIRVLERKLRLQKRAGKVAKVKRLKSRIRVLKRRL